MVWFGLFPLVSHAADFICAAVPNTQDHRDFGEQVQGTGALGWAMSRRHLTTTQSVTLLSLVWLSDSLVTCMAPPRSAWIFKESGEKSQAPHGLLNLLTEGHPRKSVTHG